MVSLKTTKADFILRDIYLILSGKVSSVAADSIEGAFAAWIYAPAKGIIKPILPTDFAVSNYSHVAHLGFLSEIDPVIFDSYEPILKDGLNRTSQRASTIAGVGPAGFYNDVIALLGLALGAKRIGGDTQSAINAWMNSFVSESSTNLPIWKKMLIRASLFILKPSTLFLIDESNYVADLQLAILSKGISCFPDVDFDTAYQKICNGTIYEETEVVLVAARLQAIDYLSNHLPAISLSQPSIQQLEQVIANLSNAFRRWVWEDKPKTSTGTTQRWDIQNEYHVQSLLYFVLAPLFPDIESEFYLENTGQLNARADIGLPSLNLIIEVKFLRSSKKFQDMLEEVAADATLYFKKDGVYKDKYSKMMVFLWDDTNRSQEHSTFRNAVKSFNNIVSAVLISRPGIISKSSFVREK